MTTHLQRNENLKPRKTQDSEYLHEVVQESLYECHLYVLRAWNGQVDPTRSMGDFSYD